MTTDLPELLHASDIETWGDEVEQVDVELARRLTPTLMALAR